MSEPELVLVPAWTRLSNQMTLLCRSENELVAARLGFEHAAATVLETLATSKSPATALTIMAREVHSFERAGKTVAAMLGGNDEPPRDGDDYEDRVQHKAHR